MGVVHGLTAIGDISCVATSYWDKHLHLSFIVPNIKARTNLNGTE